MRVLFTVSNWPSHYFPTVPLAWGLQAAGHEVRYACTPADVVPIQSAGLVPVPVLRAPDMLKMARMHMMVDALAGRWPWPHPPVDPISGEPMARLTDFDYRAALRDIMPTARRSTRAAVELGRAWRPDLVVHDLLSLEGPLVSRVLQVPSIAHLWGPIGTAEEIDDISLVPHDYTRAYERYGVGEMDHSTVAAVVDPSPAELGTRNGHRVLPVANIPYNGPGAVPTGLETAVGGRARRGGRPRVCLVWGNSVTQMFGKGNSPVPRVLAALAERDIELLVTLNTLDAGSLGDLPSNVVLLDHVPLNLLLPTCEAVIHHGGGGCTMTSLAAGVPQLVLPNGLDQPLIAERVAAAGAGLTTPAYLAEEDWIREAVLDLLGDPAYRTAAGELRESGRRRPTPARVVEQLAEMVADRELTAVAG